MSSEAISRTIERVWRDAINELVQTILNDPVLTPKLLKFINSVYFGFQKTETVSHAISLIELREVRNLAITSPATSIGASLKIQSVKQNEARIKNGDAASI